MVVGMEMWENLLVSGDWNWRGTIGIMESLAGERGAEMEGAREHEKAAKDKLSGRDRVIWASWSKNLVTANPGPGTSWTTRTCWGSSSRARADYIMRPKWAEMRGWEKVGADILCASDHDCMIARWSRASSSPTPLTERGRRLSGAAACLGSLPRALVQAQIGVHGSPEAIDAWGSYSEANSDRRISAAMGAARRARSSRIRMTRPPHVCVA